jgi:hypothetical protein
MVLSIYLFIYLSVVECMLLLQLLRGLYICAYSCDGIYAYSCIYATAYVHTPSYSCMLHMHTCDGIYAYSCDGIRAGLYIYWFQHTLGTALVFGLKALGLRP